ncbi:YdcF family protein [Ideonella sp. BN130291]|uniref:YdcF family protein n=1 Tax=Ideonella sp. BN130291 TaxID=3112940 RepID=UPI002E25E42B|nr:YdcF family protein [Ideonella sp. BN130291]
MNDLLVLLGMESWKPVLGAFLLPPVPLLLLTLVGARMILWRRGWGWLVVVLSLTGLWLSACSGVGDWLVRAALKPPMALGTDRLAELKRESASVKTAIVVLGAGREPLAPEYGISNLRPASMERLRYGVWLSRETGVPIAFSGGSGHAATSGASEADIAARIAAREFARPLKWTEPESRDTRENAAHTMALLRGPGIEQILLVTHGWHMPRAIRAFEQAAQRTGTPVRVIPAPMGLAPTEDRPVLRWLPSSEGLRSTRQALHELLGLLVGA